MPVLDGRAAAHQIKTGDGPSSQTPIIALTAHASPADQADFAAVGMAATLNKPISRDGLMAVLRDVGHETADAEQSGDALSFLLSPAFLALRDKFAHEMDDLRADLASDDLTLAQIADRAHHGAGSAATFQAEAVAAPLRDLAIAARQADNAGIDAAIAAFAAAWQTSRADYLKQAAE